MWSMGNVNKNRRYCTMYKNVLYNIQKIKKCWGGNAIFEPKTLSMYLKKKKKKKSKKKNIYLTEPGLEPTTSGLEIH